MEIVFFCDAELNDYLQTVYQFNQHNFVCEKTNKQTNKQKQNKTKQNKNKN